MPASDEALSSVPAYMGADVAPMGLWPLNFSSPLILDTGAPGLITGFYPNKPIIK